MILTPLTVLSASVVVAILLAARGMWSLLH